MNKNIEIRTKSIVADKARKEMFDKIVQDALTTRDVETYDEVLKLKASKDTMVQLKNKGSIVMALARLGYVAGSMVGIITNLIEVSGVLMDNEYNIQFLKEDSTVDLRKLRKVFPTAGSKGNEEGYSAIYMESNGNIIAVENLQGRRMRLIKALKSDISKFVEQLEMSNKFSQADLVRIGKDLEQIGRVMQELEIDSAKDATVKEGMKEITEFMSAYTCNLASKKLTISDNFAEIVANKKADAKHKKDVKFTYSIDDYLPLDNAYDEAKKLFEDYIKKNPDAPQDELNEMYDNLIDECISKSLIRDAATTFKEYMVQQQACYLNQLVEMYEESDMRLFNDFLSLGIDKDTAVINEVKKMAILACEMINNNFKYRIHRPATLATNLRNAIYTFGESKGLTPEETFRIACNAGWFKMSGDKFLYIDNYRYAAISAMFTNELKWYFNADAMYTSIDVEIPEGFAIAPNTPFYMENGECEVELEDGSTDFMFCVENYTGIVIAKIVNDEPMFVKYVNEYEYEQVEFLMFDEVCDLTQDANKYNANTASDEVIAKSVTIIKETNTKNMSDAEKKLAEEADVKRLEKSFKLWANGIELSVRKKDKFGLYSKHINKKLYLNIRQHANCESRTLGRVSYAVKTSKMDEYDKISTFVCAKGAIAILG